MNKYLMYCKSQINVGDLSLYGVDLWFSILIILVLSWSLEHCEVECLLAWLQGQDSNPRAILGIHCLVKGR